MGNDDITSNFNKSKLSKEKINKPDVAEIKAEILRYKHEMKIYNEEIYGPVTNSSLVIVVQVSVYTRIVYELFFT